MVTGEKNKQWWNRIKELENLTNPQLECMLKPEDHQLCLPRKDVIELIVSREIEA